MVEGDEAAEFLQDLLTCNVTGPDPAYGALLTPQGKIVTDMIVVPYPGGRLLDVPASQAEGLVKRLSLYRLRRKLRIEITDLGLTRGTGPAPEGAVTDPRHPAMGWRLYGSETGASDGTSWDAIRVEHAIPLLGVEMVAGESYPLEMGFERLSGVDFRKGCYVGQEVTARMKHKTELRKGLAIVAVEGEAPVGTPILRDGKAVGTLYTQSGGRGLAYLRHDRAGDGMTAGEATVAPA